MSMTLERKYELMQLRAARGASESCPQMEVQPHITFIVSRDIAEPVDRQISLVLDA